jgi:sec-independent protein translocase protein TatC
MSDVEQEQQIQESMSIWDHLNELRGRLFRAVIGLAVATAISFIISQQLVTWMAVPIGGLQRLVSIEVTENISVFMRVSLLAGFILSLPFILYQVLAFIMPGLTDAERRWVLISIPLASVFFVMGVAFAYYVMLPTALPFLVSFLGVRTTPRLSNYFDFTLNLMFWIGLSFELPLVIFILAKLKIVNAKMLANQWRIAVVVIALIAAVATPTPDPINMSILMAPLFALYLLSIFFAFIARRGESKDQG